MAKKEPQPYEQYWARTASRLISKFDEAPRRVALRAFFEERLLFYLTKKGGQSSPREAERMACDDLRARLEKEKK